MVHLVVGHKGKGKTKILLDRANEQIKEVRGSMVYLDHSSRHMYELNNQIRYINIMNYPIATGERIIGFICGILSQNRDIEVMYLDDLLRVSDFNTEEILEIVKELDRISETWKLDLTMSLSIDKEHLPEDLQEKVLISL